jgi:hypothetical protein
MKMMRSLPTSVRPELVEGLYFGSQPLKKGQGFDKLSPNVMGSMWQVRKSKH